MNKRAFLVVLLLIIFAVALRLLPHVPNATPLTAVMFVSAIYLGRRWAFAIPFLVLGITDAVIGLYEWQVMVSVYLSFALIAAISAACKNRGVFGRALGVVSSSFLFFLITNAAVWAFSPWYEKSITGLLYAYELGIPFLRPMLLGDILYAAGLFGVFELCCALMRARRAKQTLLIPTVFN